MIEIQLPKNITDYAVKTFNNIKDREVYYAMAYINCRKVGNQKHSTRTTIIYPSGEARYYFRHDMKIFNKHFIDTGALTRKTRKSIYLTFDIKFFNKATRSQKLKIEIFPNSKRAYTILEKHFKVCNMTLAEKKETFKNHKTTKKEEIDIDEILNFDDTPKNDIKLGKVFKEYRKKSARYI